MWMYEKIHREWTDNRGLPEVQLTRDQMLDDISLYWIHWNRYIEGARLYWEGVGSTIRENSFFSNSRASSTNRSTFRWERPSSRSKAFLAPRSWAEAALVEAVLLERG